MPDKSGNYSKWGQMPTPFVVSPTPFVVSPTPFVVSPSNLAKGESVARVASGDLRRHERPFDKPALSLSKGSGSE
ncbi:MAG: hypothetical protein WBC82_01500 [Dehalococcoidia bacterium]